MPDLTAQFEAFRVSLVAELEVIIDRKLEEKLEEKLEQKLEQKLAPIRATLRHHTYLLGQFELMLNQDVLTLARHEELLQRIERRLSLAVT